VHGHFKAVVIQDQSRVSEVAWQMKGLRNQMAAQAVKRFGAALEKGTERHRFIAELKRQLSTI
jgi:hypothetical protein